jgi:hypothetical protein
MMVFLDPSKVPETVKALEKELNRDPSGATAPKHGEGYIVKKSGTVAVTQ